MARLSRLVVPGQLHYVVQDGIDRLLVFRQPEDHRAMLGWFRDAARRYRVAIHAYALLPHGWRFLATPADEEGLGKMMQWIGRYYVPYFNQKYQRAGTLWQGRFKATVIEARPYLLPAIRFIETVEVQETGAGADYPWSSHRHHIGAEQDALITEHSLYWMLGNTPFDREVAYRNLLQKPLPVAEIEKLRLAFGKGWVLGSAKFCKEMEKAAGRPVTPARRGRPPKPAAGQEPPSGIPDAATDIAKEI